MSSKRQQAQINTLERQMAELVARVEKLEAKKGPGRPPKEPKDG